MSDWKVSKEKIELFTHPNADALEVGKVGSYQVVVQRGLYKDGDEVIFVPEKSVLEGEIKTSFENYLVGPNHNRVKGVRLRGEISSGILVPKHLVPNFDDYSIGIDISDDLCISKYEPPIPQELEGSVKPYEMNHIGSHDCDQIAIYINQIVQGERVIITEKVHGSQFILAHDLDNDETMVSSKGMLEKGLCIDDSETNTYWQASKNDDIVNKIKSNFDNGIVQVFGEVLPVQGGYSYGRIKPSVLIFDVRVNSISIPYDRVPQDLLDLWVPILFDGDIKLEEEEIVLYENKEEGIRKTKTNYSLPKEIIKLCKGKELVSGNSIHIREGFVLRPYVDRNARDGKSIRLKLINPAYKETGEEIN